MTGPQPAPPDRAAQEDKLGRLGQVAGELVHDMADLVAALDGRLRLALGEARLGRTPVTEMERAVAGSAELGSMIRDVLAALRGAAEPAGPGMQPEAVAERAIRRALEVSRPVEIRMTSTLAPGTTVPGRSSFLYRALGNLLANAGRHAASRILVTLEHSPDGTVLAAVEDDGPGVPPGAREAVFRPLVHGGSGGTGLGLSSVAWSVEQLGGRVRCTAGTRLGGARFELHLPARAGAASAIPERACELAGKRVMVMDDNPDVRRVLGRFLSRAGAEFVEAGPPWNSDEALVETMIRAMPDAVVLDLNLGARTGVEVWSLLRDRLPPLADRVLFLSGAGPGDAVYEEALRTGARVLPKPFDFGEVGAALEEVAHRS
ncbi:MAG TPA: ATP-binding protein [Longimicrobiaceae bacterium]|nr:ATP-binding protein [Longimicrobiaceae bacterium]